MTIGRKIANWTERRNRRRRGAQSAFRRRRQARKDRRQIRRELLTLRHERDSFPAGQARAEAADLCRELARELREANAEIDALTEKGRARQAGVRRATRKIRALRRSQRREVITRAEWGAAPPRGTFARQGPIVGFVQHHTANVALPPTATIAQECDRMRQMQAGHFVRGFTDLGYAYVVMPSGRIYEGRPAGAVGAHTLGRNTGYYGTAYDANTEASIVTTTGLVSLRRVRRNILKAASYKVYGHRDLNPTACPGRDLYGKLNRL